MSDDEKRNKIRNLLEGGVQTETARVDDGERKNVLSKIRQAGDVEDKIKVAGFTLEPVDHDGVEESCEGCMYYLVRRRFCELPELAVPVEPEWSCRVWRI